MSIGVKICTAFVNAQAELKAITKDSENPHFRSKFASLDTIIEDVRPILARHGLAILQSAEATADGKAMIVHSTLVHESGEQLGNSVPIPIGKQDAQGAGGALTYGRRYGISALLCLATEEDDDGNTASRAPKAASQAAKPRTQTALVETRSAGEATPAPSTNGRAKEPEYRVFKGKPLKDYDTPELERLLKWSREKNQDELRDAIATVLANRVLGEDPDSKANRQVAAAVAAVEKESASLPFK